MRPFPAALVLLTLLAAACPPSGSTHLPARAELRRLTGTTIEVLPAQGQFPHCLLFTRSQSGVIRQLTMSLRNTSIRCEPGKPIGGVAYRIPLNEGTVHILALFSTQELNAASIARQIVEMNAAGRHDITAFDFRAPGQIAIEKMEFTPTEEPVTTTGVVVEAGGATGSEPDAGPGTPGSTGEAHPDAGATGG